MKLPKRRLTGLLLAAISVALLLWYSAGRPASHPSFGRIHLQVASTSQTQIEKLLKNVGEKLGIPSRTRWVGPIAPLSVGSAILGWSARSQDDGYFYMADMFTWTNPLWEFAPCEKQQLSALTDRDLTCEFYTMNDPRGDSVFKVYGMEQKWSGRTVNVSVGQIILARLTTNHSTIYAIRVADQIRQEGKDTVRIEFLSVTNPPPRSERL